MMHKDWIKVIMINIIIDTWANSINQPLISFYIVYNAILNDELEFISYKIKPLFWIL